MELSPDLPGGRFGISAGDHRRPGCCRSFFFLLAQDEVLLLVLLLVTAATFYLINAWIVDEAQKRVRRHLHAAREVLRQEERHLSEILQLSARSPDLAGARPTPPVLPSR